MRIVQLQQHLPLRHRQRQDLGQSPAHPRRIVEQPRIRIDQAGVHLLQDPPQQFRQQRVFRAQPRRRSRDPPGTRCRRPPGRCRAPACAARGSGGGRARAATTARPACCRSPRSPPRCRTPPASPARRPRRHPGSGRRRSPSPCARIRRPCRGNAARRCAGPARRPAPARRAAGTTAARRRCQASRRAAWNRRGAPSKPPLDMNTTWSPVRAMSRRRARSAHRRSATAAPSPRSARDHLAGIPGQFRAVQEHHHVGVVQRRRERVGMRAQAHRIAARFHRHHDARVADASRAARRAWSRIAVGWCAKSSYTVMPRAFAEDFQAALHAAEIRQRRDHRRHVDADRVRTRRARPGRSSRCGGRATASRTMPSSSPSCSTANALPSSRSRRALHSKRGRHRVEPKRSTGVQQPIASTSAQALRPRR